MPFPLHFFNIHFGIIYSRALNFDNNHHNLDIVKANCFVFSRIEVRRRLVKLNKVSFK